MMIRMIAVVLLVVAAQATASGAMADDIVAMLDLKFVEDTGDAAAVMCFDDDECINWSTYYLFDATVKRVISGEPPNEKFKLIYGQHALKQEDFDGVLGWIRALKVPHKSGAKYQMIAWGEERSLICFGKQRGRTLDVEIEIEPNDPLSCVEASERE